MSELKSAVSIQLHWNAFVFILFQRCCAMVVQELQIDDYLSIMVVSYHLFAIFVKNIEYELG